MSVHHTLPIHAGSDRKALSLHLVSPADSKDLSGVLKDLPSVPALLEAQGFKGKEGDFALIPDESGVRGAVFCAPLNQGPLPFGVLARRLPEGRWRPLSHAGDEALLRDVALGFCLGAYRYHLGRKPMEACPQLVVPSAVEKDVSILARAAWLGRDLINHPANLLGPQELAAEAQAALHQRGAKVEVVQGEALRKAYPCLAAVGAGSDRPAAVLVARWKAREGARRLSLVGKGVCFDTGGYDLKPGASMAKMKKDMGGAALMLALACALIEAKADVDLELRLGCVENSVSGHAMRPGDVLATRAGLMVEVGNTDAEGRLILCDLLAEAAESQPDLLLDAATLTGAARVALGPDLPALFCNDDAVAQALLDAGTRVHDPLWRLPLWAGYDSWLESTIADCNNLSSCPMAGAITAALYLQRFIPAGQTWAHIDTYAWNETSQSGRPAGGETLALRALFEMFTKPA